MNDTLCLPGISILPNISWVEKEQGSPFAPPGN